MILYLSSRQMQILLDIYANINEVFTPFEITVLKKYYRTHYELI
jgi:hypothetical protein